MRAPRAELFDSVPSVLDTVHRMGAEGEPSGSIALADSQTDGRGRAGRAWYSPAGGGIWLALLLRPALAPQGGTLAIRAGLCIVDALRACQASLDARLKWPNDVMVHGRKAGGVLCEARWSGTRLGWVAIGVGLNVTGDVDERVSDTAGTIAPHAPGITRLAILKELVPRLAALHTRPALLEPEERIQFQRRMWLPPGAGTVVGLEPDGALLLRRSNGSMERRTVAD